MKSYMTRFEEDFGVYFRQELYQLLQIKYSADPKVIIYNSIVLFDI